MIRKKKLLFVLLQKGKQRQDYICNPPSSTTKKSEQGLGGGEMESLNGGTELTMNKLY